MAPAGRGCLQAVSAASNSSMAAPGTTTGVTATPGGMPPVQPGAMSPAPPLPTGYAVASGSYASQPGAPPPPRATAAFGSGSGPCNAVATTTTLASASVPGANWGTTTGGCTGNWQGAAVPQWRHGGAMPPWQQQQAAPGMYIA